MRQGQTSTNSAKWDDLKVFLEVARQGSVHAAARRLKLDHSTVCRRIGRLESLLAVKLFDRGRRGISVRTEAHGLLKHIEQMDRHAGSLEDAIARGGADASQAVRVATMEGIASGYLARCLPALEQFGKNLKLELVSIPQAVDLNRKEADIFLSFFNPDARGLKSALFGRFRALSLLFERVSAAARHPAQSRGSRATHLRWLHRRPAVDQCGTLAGRGGDRADHELSQQ